MAMENSKVRNGRQYSLPPKTPFPTVTCPFYASALNRSKGIMPKYAFHQRTCSDSLGIEEQPSWLDELLDEPETPPRRGHRRCSSDSLTNVQQNVSSASSWGFQDFHNNSRVWDSPQTEKQETLEPCMQDSPTTNSSASQTDTKPSKQQFAQRSRVRKLQYIAELERNVQVLEAEGSELSGELKFLNQRSLILTMENKALKQRLENLAQEQLIKYLEHEILEREIGRLRALYKQQQQPQAENPLFSHQRTSSMESQFANISLKNKESVAVRDGPLRI